MAIDQMVLATQNWLNDTYGSDPRFEIVPENGKTGWATIYGLIRALQIELGIQNTSNNFGPTTQSLYVPIQRDDNVTSNLFGIVQGALWCKGYNTGHYAVVVNGRNHVNQLFDLSVENAVKQLQEDAGRNIQTGIVDLNTIKALLSMDSFVCISSLGGNQNIRTMQQYLNRFYEAYIGLAPCDGIYGRTTNKALIYALQAEEGLSTSAANGNFGPSTRAHCPTIPYDNVATNNNGSHYTFQSITKFVNILKISLYCNGFGSYDLDGVFDSDDELAVRTFQTKYVIPVTGIVNLGTWLSLLLSCGDVNRSSVACDTATKLNSAKAMALYEDGFRYVGRYLTKVEGGLDKDLTRLEEKVIFSKGLSIFPIFQEYGGDASAFYYNKGTQDAIKAKNAAEALGIPHRTTIYYAVDFDPQQTAIINNVIPYFQGIYDYYKNNRYYRIGVYGTRNVCRLLKESDEVVIDNMFIADASSGFSGNLGFPIPTGWAFDQFCVDNYSIGSGEGAITVDKVAYSGVDNGYNKLLYTTMQESFNNIFDLYDLAMDYTNNNENLSNQLVLQYIRKGKYGDSTLFGENSIISKGAVTDLMWNLVAGNVDSNFCTLADNNGHSEDIFEFKDPYENEMNDFVHLAATLNALLYNTGGLTSPVSATEQIIDIYAGWGGDAVSFSKNVKQYAEEMPSNYQTIANSRICTDYNTNFTISDYIADIDAVNLYYYISGGHTLPEAINFYYGLQEYEKRTRHFINNIGGFTNFNNCCNQIKSNSYLLFHYALAGEISSEYIDNAITAFSSFVSSKYQSEEPID